MKYDVTYVRVFIFPYGTFTKYKLFNIIIYTTYEQYVRRKYNKQFYVTIINVCVKAEA